MHWEDAVKLPWGILLLFGGGLAIAAGFQSSGLASWIAENFTQLSGFSLFIIFMQVPFVLLHAFSTFPYFSISSKQMPMINTTYFKSEL